MQARCGFLQHDELPVSTIAGKGAKYRLPLEGLDKGRSLPLSAKTRCAAIRRYSNESSLGTPLLSSPNACNRPYLGKRIDLAAGGKRCVLRFYRVRTSASVGFTWCKVPFTPLRKRLDALAWCSHRIWKKPRVSMHLRDFV